MYKLRESTLSVNYQNFPVVSCEVDKMGTSNIAAPIYSNSFLKLSKTPGIYNTKEPYKSIQKKQNM